MDACNRVMTIMARKLNLKLHSVPGVDDVDVMMAGPGDLGMNID